MMPINPEQLQLQLKKGLKTCYLLAGNEPFLLQESYDQIRHEANAQGFNEHLSLTLDAHTEWNTIFMRLQSFGLFSQRLSIQLRVQDQGQTPASFSVNTAKQLIKLAELLHEDILLILMIGKVSKAKENTAWFKALTQQGVYLVCQAPARHLFPSWINQRAEHFGLKLEQAANERLCDAYEGNLLALSQALEQLGLCYPEKTLSLNQVSSFIEDAPRFNVRHWLDALLSGKIQRAFLVLQQLAQEDTEPLILLRSLQQELLLLLKLKTHRSDTPQRLLFDQYHVWQNQRPLLQQAMQQLSMTALQQAFQLLTNTEIVIKKENDFSNKRALWQALEQLSMLICGRAFPEYFFNAESTEP